MKKARCDSHLQPRLLVKDAPRERKREAQVARGGDRDRRARSPGGQHERAVDLHERPRSRAGRAPNHSGGVTDCDLTSGIPARFLVVSDAR